MVITSSFNQDNTRTGYTALLPISHAMFSYIPPLIALRAIIIESRLQQQQNKSICIKQKKKKPEKIK